MNAECGEDWFFRIHPSAFSVYLFRSGGSLSRG
jgi:hypothetical protein